MLIPIVAILATILGVLVLWVERDSDEPWGITFLACSWAVILTWLSLLTPVYLGTKGDQKIIDDKIKLTEEINQERINSVIPILEKYPQMEKEIIGDIDPNAFAVLGDVYPDLKSNQSYRQQATLVTENIKKIEDLKIQQLEIQRSFYIYGKQLWLFK